MSKTRSSVKGRTTIALLIAAVAALVAVAPGVASKGGNKGSNAAQSTGAWVSATPSPLTVGGHVNLAGCGYQFEKSLSVIITSAGTDAELDGLTAREREGLQLIARGYRYKEIAARLHLPVKTDESYVSSMLRNLQLSSRHELTRRAAERRLI